MIQWLTTGSWKTTSAGLLAILGGLVRAAFALKAGNLTEEAVMTAFTAIVTGLGLLVARDNDKSSEQVGANSGNNPPPAALLLPFLLLVTLGAGCRPLDPGADPWVVNIERAQQVAEPAFDLVLDLDQADRGFWRTNAPAFHAFCETLRVPVVWRTDGRESLPRYIAAQLQVSRLKQDYKATKSAASSNALAAAQLALQQLVSQTQAWATIITNTPTH